MVMRLFMLMLFLMVKGMFYSGSLCGVMLFSCVICVLMKVGL